MKNFQRVVVANLVLSFFFALPVFSQEWIDATSVFEEQSRWLADNATKETLGEYEFRTKGIVQFADVKPPEVGDEVKFSVFNFVKKEEELVPAVLKRIGKHCYVYLEKGKTLSPESIEKNVEAFDEVIYPKNTSIFGNEWNPGIDSDPKIILFFLDIRDGASKNSSSNGFVAGFFRAGDEYSKEVNPASNEHEMLYLDINPGDPSQERYMNLVAHEFQHMIHWHHDPKELNWVNEGLSQLAGFLNGFDHPSQVFSFIKCSDNNLVSWSSENMLSNYGQVYLFFQYLVTHLASTQEDRTKLIRNIVKEKANGIEGIKKALLNVGVNQKFSTIFKNFCVANFVNDSSIKKGVFGYDKTLKKLRIAPLRKEISVKVEGKSSVKLWSSRAVKMKLPYVKGELKISFQGQTQGERDEKNSFDLASVLLDSEKKISPIVDWVSLKGNQAKQEVISLTGEHDSLLLVICNRGPEDEMEQPFAKGFSSAQFSYSVTAVGKGKQLNGAIAKRSKMKPQTLKTLVGKIAKRNGHSEGLKAVSSGEQNSSVQAAIGGFSDSDLNVEEENLVVDSIRLSLSENDLGFVADFFALYNSSGDLEKKNLQSLYKKVIDVINFERLQNNNSQLESFLK